MGERRWSDWFLQVRDAGIVLVLCLPTEFAGVAALTEGADRILVLTGDDVDAPDDERVVVLRGEQVAGAAVPPVAPADSPPAEPAGVEQLFAASAAPAPKGRSRGSESRPGKVFLLAFLVVVLLLIVASWLGLVSIPGLTGSGSTG